MYFADDIIENLRLPKDLRAELCELLGVDYEDITFFFIEFEEDRDGKHAIISAESGTKFAILKCPAEYLGNIYERRTDELIDRLMMDWALDQYNKAETDAQRESWIAYMKEYRREKDAPVPNKSFEVCTVINEVDEYEFHAGIPFEEWGEEDQYEEDLYFMPDEDE